MILETTMMPMRHGIPQFADIVRFCDEAGFAVYDVLEGHMRSLDGALAQIDLAFIRKYSAAAQPVSLFQPRPVRGLSDAAEQAARREATDRRLARRCCRGQSPQSSASRMNRQRRSPLFTMPPRCMPLPSNSTQLP